MIKTTVIFPARNEEGLIKTAVLEIYKYLKTKNYKFEIIVVENGSSDKTTAILTDLQNKYEEVNIYKSKPGYGFALRKGLEKAKGNYVVIFNVDFYDNKLIDLIDIDLFGKDFIIGSKRAHWSSDRRPFVRRMISLLFNEYLHLIYNFKGSDTHGIKLVRKSVINEIYKKCKTTSGIFDTEFVLRAQDAGFKFADFPVTVEEKRPPRFTNRIMQTPIDLYYLTKSLSK